MRDDVLENYGVVVTVGAGGVRYVLPWMKDGSLKGNGWGILFVAALPCLAVSVMPVLFMRAMLPGAPLLGVIFFWVFSVFWWLMSAFFTCLFGAMAYSAITQWGCARVWVKRSWIGAVQLRGDESRFAFVPLGSVTGFSTIVDGKDRSNPATPGRLLADVENDVKRLLGGYPLELLEALRRDMERRVKDMRVK